MIKPDAHLHLLVSAPVIGLNNGPRMIANCCWTLMNLVDQYSAYYEDEGEVWPTVLWRCITRVS